MSEKKSYYVTFGVGYAREPHPYVDWAHPDGWWRIVADNYEQARQIADDVLGRHYAFLYDSEEFDADSKSFYPVGELATWNGTELIAHYSVRLVPVPKETA